MGNNSQDRPGGQVEWEKSRFRAPPRVTPPPFNPLANGDHTNSSTAAPKGAGGDIKPREVVTRVGRGTSRDRCGAARQPHTAHETLPSARTGILGGIFPKEKIGIGTKAYLDGWLTAGRSWHR